MSIKATIHTARAATLVALADTIIAAAGAVYHYLDERASSSENAAHDATVESLRLEAEKTWKKHDKLGAALVRAEELADDIRRQRTDLAHSANSIEFDISRLADTYGAGVY